MTNSKPSIEDLFKHLLDEMKGFKYQITLKVSLSKYKENADREFASVYFNSATKPVIGPKYDLYKSFHIIRLVKDLVR